MSTRRRFAWLLPVSALAGAPLAAVSAQPPPPHAGLTTSRVLVLPVQAVAGPASSAAVPAAWLARYDSVLTARLFDGGLGSGWAYASDAARYRRSNPSYLSDPRAMGAQALLGDKVKDGFVLPEPFGSRLRPFIALADARLAIVPVAAVIDSPDGAGQARLRLAVVDGRSSKVVVILDVSSAYAGGAMAAADSLAFATARLFVK